MQVSLFAPVLFEQGAPSLQRRTYFGGRW